MTFKIFRPSKKRIPRAVEVCRSKVKYYNEVSAKRAVKWLSLEYDTNFTYYRCGESKHFHLTHTDPSQRIGHGNKETSL